jgi:uncharacterized protein (TIGR02231 family)
VQKGGELEDGDGEDEGSHQSADATMNSTSATFTIPRKATILNDGKPHKATIKILQLRASFSYTVVPKLTQQAYLKATVRNSSKNYILLAGEMSVFMDNNFVAKSDIMTVAPNETFVLYLGVDHAIKVQYRPEKRMKEQTGLFTKTNKLAISRTCVLTNNKEEDVSIAMFEQLPKSSDSEVKVKLTDPEIPSNVDAEDMDAPVMLSPANNVRWFFGLKAGEKREVKINYTIEWAADREIIENTDSEGFGSGSSVVSRSSIATNPLYSMSSSIGTNPMYKA